MTQNIPEIYGSLVFNDKIMRSKLPKDMYKALKAGKIGGYASDVMENELAGGGLTEGAGFDSPLFECENFLVSPHLGAQSTDASRDIGAHIIAKVKEALNLG